MAQVAVANVQTLAGPVAELSKRQRYLRQQKALFEARLSWDAHWREIAEFLQPRAGRFDTSRGANDGRIRHNSIYDSTGLRARRILAAGLMSGLTSPARPWFRLTLPDTSMMEYQPVKVWLKRTSEIMRDIFRESNTYRALPKIYHELASFGTAASFLEDDFADVIRHYPSTVGEYAIAENDRREVDTIVRRFDMTVEQLVRKFGLANVSRSVKNDYDQGNYYKMHPAIHMVKPRAERDYRKRDAKNMAFMSCWLEERGADPDRPDILLRESGYKRFPALTPRWDTTSGDFYGESPGMEALGDVKQLMHEQMRKAQAIDYQTNPPIQVPSSYKGQEVQRFPGGVMFYDATTASGGIKSAYEVQLNLQHLLPDIIDIRERINQAFFVDLFLMIANVERSNVTAREIAEKQEEKLLQLGPVMQALDDELLEPLIDYTFERMVTAKMLPVPPPEMQGMPLNIEFNGVLSQAQRAVGIGSVDRLLGTIGSIAQLKPDVLDKLDADQVVDAYADMLGVDPELIVADDKVAFIRAQRQQAEQAQTQMATMQPMADSMKTMSETNVEQPSVLKELIGYS